MLAVQELIGVPLFPQVEGFIELIQPAMIPIVKVLVDPLDKGSELLLTDQLLDLVDRDGLMVSYSRS